MLLYGASGHAQVVKDCVNTSGGEVKAIFDDNQDLFKLDETPVIGYYKPDYEPQELIIVTVGDNLVRKKIVNRISHHFGKGIHRGAIVSDHSTVGEGSVIMPGAIVNAGSSVGKHCIINTNAVVEHDCEIGDFVHVSSNVTLCGNILVGEGTHIGAGSTIIPGKYIGKWCVIGAGAVIIEDIPDYSMVVGVPGKIIKTLIRELV
ncbi:MAG: acetyltransferase [Cytophagales bacterium]|nr:acetyltransferase [Cytophaga sp.]